MLKIFTKLFSSDAGARRIVAGINALEPEVQKLSDEDLREESKKLQHQSRVLELEQKAKLDELLPRAFALTREAAKRTLGQRHFDVQLIGGIVLHEGKIAEMRTGEGKTLAATAPVYLNALPGKGVHVVTVNEYLAKRDTVWMGQIYHALGLSVTCLVHEGALMYDPDFTGEKSQEHTESALLDKERDTTGSFRVQDAYLRPISRREAYEADITYGTNHEFGFDYLRDNLAHSLDGQVQRNERYFAIVDEVDSILIDEARTPLIISAPDAESSQFYKTFARAVAQLKKDEDYLVDEKLKSVDITQEGIDRVEQMLNIQNIYAAENLRLTHYLQESLKAKELFLRDRDYVVKNNEVIIVDQFTGRLMAGRRYSGGLHQAIEAKEGVLVQQESRTYATISIQNYFRLYRKLSGMTGTAQTSAEEFHKVYTLEVATVPTHRQMVRIDNEDLIYKNADAKYAAIISDVRQRKEKGQPVLIGTVSIEKNETLSRRLADAGLKHEVLNAKNNEREGTIIAQAGRPGAVTVATNMAGRGVDIILGGNPPLPANAEKVKAAGGLHVIGTERHDSRRIDNQLRGRAGRQGDSGSSQFFLSLEDDLMRVFGGDRIKGLMQTLNIPDDMPIQARLVSRAVTQAQAKVEGMNFDARKHLLEFDDVLNKQRVAMYRKRQELLESKTLEVTRNQEPGTGEEHTDERQKEIISLPSPALSTVLSALDMFWMNHLENMEALRDAVGLRAYGQHEPLVEYRREGHLMFQALLREFDAWIAENRERIGTMTANDDHDKRNEKQNDPVIGHPSSVIVSGGHAAAKVGRNDPCPCGAKHPDGRPMKYKHCHGR